ncbi:hypothetical protein B0H10DRAFT_2297498 [Mycena sp. CBHHK59/15]|nr:hypothetical protein B0H10DRAFT_2297498 [Mycena sp. CBHHK59/15]
MNKTDHKGNESKDRDGETDVEMHDEVLDVFYEGDKQHNPVVHGWIQRDIENNHCPESLAQIRDHPNTTVLAVIITSDRTTREGGADAILDVLERRGWISPGDKTRVLTPTPAVGSSTNVAIHPFTDVIADCSPELMDCPILNSAGYRSAHDIVDVNTNAQSEVAMTLSLVTTAPSNAASTSSDTGGWQTVRGGHHGGNPYRGVGHNYHGGYNCGGGYGGYGRSGHGF